MTYSDVLALMSFERNSMLGFVLNLMQVATVRSLKMIGEIVFGLFRVISIALARILFGLLSYVMSLFYHISLLFLQQFQVFNFDACVA